MAAWAGEVEVRRAADGATTVVARASQGSVMTVAVGDMKVVATCTEVPMKGATTTTAHLSLRGVVDIAALVKHGIDLAEALQRWGFL